MTYANDYQCPTDNETIEKALENLDADRTLILSSRKSEVEMSRVAKDSYVL